ncbi:MAG TPA: peptidoglycan-binding domain-containing protein [Gemmatimonadota bacterium]|nr:peptidoglycan-binding domain-containing protein [Gemmatimonadota bacterium]
MTDSSYFLRSLALGLTMVVGTPIVARSQPAVAPATAVRVIEVIDPRSGSSVRQVAEDLTPAEIARVQRALAAAGFVTGRATGTLNPTTRLALGRFQAARGLHRCECVSYETVVALGIRPVVVAAVRAPIQRGYGSDVVVVVPHHRVGVGHRSAVVVGHGPSVFVGHDPARGGSWTGAGRTGVRAPADPRPPRPRPGVSVSGSGAEIRALTPPRPRSRTPFPGSAVAAP